MTWFIIAALVAFAGYQHYRLLWWRSRCEDLEDINAILDSHLHPTEFVPWDDVLMTFEASS